MRVPRTSIASSVPGAASAGLGAVGGTIRVTTVDAKDLLTDGKPFGFKLGAGLSSNGKKIVNWPKRTPCLRKAERAS